MVAEVRDDAQRRNYGGDSTVVAVAVVDNTAVAAGGSWRRCYCLTSDAARLSLTLFRLSSSSSSLSRHLGSSTSSWASESSLWESKWNAEQVSEVEEPFRGRHVLADIGVAAAAAAAADAGTLVDERKMTLRDTAAADVVAACGNVESDVMRAEAVVGTLLGRRIHHRQLPHHSRE